MEYTLPPHIAYRGNLNIGSMVEPTKMSNRILGEDTFREYMSNITDSIINSAREASEIGGKDATLYFGIPDEFLFGDVIQFFSDKSQTEIEDTARIEAEKKEIARQERYRLYMELSKEFGQHIAMGNGVDIVDEDDLTGKVDTAMMKEVMGEYGISMDDLMG